jgi:hypothetical protein
MVCSNVAVYHLPATTACVNYCCVVWSRVLVAAALHVVATHKTQSRQVSEWQQAQQGQAEHIHQWPCLGVLHLAALFVPGT